MSSRGKCGSGRPLALPLVTVILSAWTSFAGAQASPAGMGIQVPSRLEVEIAAESPLPIRITPDGSAPEKAMVLIRDLPASVALTEGRLFDSGVWAVRVADLPRLRIAAPAHTVEKRRLFLSLVSLDGTVLANAESSLAVVPAMTARQPRTAATARDARPSTSAATPKPSLTLEEIERAQLFMRKGEENLHAGNIVVARLFFTRAATAGWAPGAFALARTYDPAELKRIAIAGGINSDPALARKWYKRADELGAIEARDRLRRLRNR